MKLFKKPKPDDIEVELLKLEADRLKWIGCFIEWNELGFEPEAKFALENVRGIRRAIDAYTKKLALPRTITKA